jgi:hypothetical protein
MLFELMTGRMANSIFTMIYKLTAPAYIFSGPGFDVSPFLLNIINNHLL